MGGDHKCPVCQATFTRPQHVARHMRSHTGDRPYKCQHCGDQFARSDLLSRHINKCHASEKPPTTSVPNQRRKGTASASRATTSKQACDQCVTGTLPCDGANPCSKCVQRKTRCTYVKFHRQTAPAGPGHLPPRPTLSSTAPSLPPISFNPSLQGVNNPPLSLSHPANSLLGSNQALLGMPSSDGYGLYAQSANQLAQLGAHAQAHAPLSSAPLYAQSAAANAGPSPLYPTGDYMAISPPVNGYSAARIPRAAFPPQQQPFLFPGQHAYGNPHDLTRLSSHSPTPSLTMSGSTRDGNDLESGGSSPSGHRAILPAAVAPEQDYAARYRIQAELLRRQGLIPPSALARGETTQLSTDGQSDSEYEAMRAHAIDSVYSFDPNVYRHAAHVRNSSGSSLASSVEHRSIHLRGGHSESADEADNSGTDSSTGDGSNNASRSRDTQAGPNPAHPPEGGFSSAFGLMSLDDPNVLAGLAADGHPFFTNTGLTPNVFGLQTPRASKDKEKQGPFAHLFSPLKSPLSHWQKQLGLDKDGKTPMSSRELESKEMRDFWKQYLRTPLSGGGPLGGTAADSARRPVLARGLSRVSSLPDMKTPSASMHVAGSSYAPPAEDRARTLHGTADDLRSYEQAVLARKMPMTLNPPPRKPRASPSAVASPELGDIPPVARVLELSERQGSVNAQGALYSRPSSANSSSSLAGAIAQGRAEHLGMPPPPVPVRADDALPPDETQRPSFKRNASQTLEPETTKRALTEDDVAHASAEDEASFAIPARYPDRYRRMSLPSQTGVVPLVEGGFA